MQVRLSSRLVDYTERIDIYCRDIAKVYVNMQRNSANHASKAQIKQSVLREIINDLSKEYLLSTIKFTSNELNSMLFVIKIWQQVSNITTDKMAFAVYQALTDHIKALLDENLQNCLFSHEEQILIYLTAIQWRIKNLYAQKSCEGLNELLKNLLDIVADHQLWISYVDWRSIEERMTELLEYKSAEVQQSYQSLLQKIKFNRAIARLVKASTIETFVELKETSEQLCRIFLAARKYVAPHRLSVLTRYANDAVNAMQRGDKERIDRQIHNTEQARSLRLDKNTHSMIVFGMAAFLFALFTATAISLAIMTGGFGLFALPLYGKILSGVGASLSIAIFSPPLVACSKNMWRNYTGHVAYGMEQHSRAIQNKQKELQQPQIRLIPCSII